MRLSQHRTLGGTIPSLAIFLGIVATCLMLVPRSCPAQGLRSLYTFSTTTSDGRLPHGSLIKATDGYLYGTTYIGGTFGFGTVFRIHPDGSDYSILHQFTNGSDGSNPSVTLVQASNGNIYGTTAQGGAFGGGTFFRVTPDGVFKTISDFSLPVGIGPDGGLIEVGDGHFCGIAPGGGAYGKGTIFRVSTAGTLTTLHDFKAGEGEPITGRLGGRILQASDGNLYGATFGGGTGGVGTIFRLTLGGTYTTIHNFNTTDGAYPNGDLIQASDGRLYGTTQSGGASGQYGTVFRISTDGNLFNVLHDFDTTDAYQPLGGLVQADDGDLYGSAYFGGLHLQGGLYRITRAGVFTPLFDFDSFDGGRPAGSMLQESPGVLYGVTSFGGIKGYGSIFVLPLANFPVITGLSPISTEVGHPDFTLTVTGKNFQNETKVYWNNQPLETTYKSSTKLTAIVPTALLTTPRLVNIKVRNVDGGVSTDTTFTVHPTVLKLISTNVSKDGAGNYVVNFTLKNVGNVTASSVNLVSGSLGTASTAAALPINLGSVAAGGTVSTTLVFPPSAGTSGSTVTLVERCLFTYSPSILNAGSESSVPVTLP